MPINKFTQLDNTAYQYGNLYQIRQYEQWSVLIAAPDQQQIKLISQICAQWEGPFGILYVLVASRCGRESGRYQSSESATHEQLSQFLSEFSDYFEQDGRHHLWIMDMASERRLIYDNHNLIYCYEDNQNIAALCESLGLKQGEINITAPHSHRYNLAHDANEDRIFDEFNWIHFPLVEEQDNP